jgi:hypothetical protein
LSWCGVAGTRRCSGYAGACSSIARSPAVWLVIISVVVAIVAYLVGRPRWLTTTIAWVGRNVRAEEGGSALERAVHAHFDLYRIAALVVGAIVLFVWGIGWLSVLLLVVLVALIEWGLWELDARAVRAAALVGAAALPAEATPLTTGTEPPQLSSGTPAV